MPAQMTAGFLQDADREQMLALVDLNVRGLLDLTLRLLPGMVARGKGGVLNVSSVEGFMPVPYQAAYAATKAFVLSLSARSTTSSRAAAYAFPCLRRAPPTRASMRAAARRTLYYVSLFPVMTPGGSGAPAYRQFVRGKAVIVPGWLNRFYAVSQRFVHPGLLLPVLGWLFRVRDEQGERAMAAVHCRARDHRASTARRNTISRDKLVVGAAWF